MHSSALLTKDEGSELVVAVTHMRVPNDRKLASLVPDLDLVLGGHDHHYEVDFVPPHNTLVCKSGSDFKDMTRIDVKMPARATRPEISWSRLTQDSGVPEDPEVSKVGGHVRIGRSRQRKAITRPQRGAACYVRGLRGRTASFVLRGPIQLTEIERLAAP